MKKSFTNFPINALIKLLIFLLTIVTTQCTCDSELTGENTLGNQSKTGTKSIAITRPSTPTSQPLGGTTGSVPPGGTNTSPQEGTGTVPQEGTGSASEEGESTPEGGKKPEEQKAEEQKPEEVKSPLPKLTGITADMIQKAKAAEKKFLADTLEKLMKEYPQTTQFSYINDQNSDGETALYQAGGDFTFNEPEIVKALLERGADPNIATNGFETPLNSLSMCEPDKSLETIRLLLEANADPLIGIDENKPLIRAMENSYDNNVEAAKLMLEKVPDINIQDSNGDTLLHHAVRKGQVELIKFLIAKKARTDIPNKPNPSDPDHGNKTAKELAQYKSSKIKALFDI